MPLHSLVRQIKTAANSYPFKWLARKVFLDIFGMSAQINVRSSCTFLFGASLIWCFFLVYWLGDNDVILAVELVHDRGVLFVDEELFLEFKFELILPVRFDLDKGNTNWWVGLQLLTIQEMVTNASHRYFLDPVVPWPNKLESFDQ